MEFITLIEAVANIAKCVKLTPHNQDTSDFIHPISQEAAIAFWETVNPKIEWARRFGIAAMQLNKALHDKPIQWMEYDKEKRFAVRSNIIHEEGVELLTHATLWGSRELDNCCNHFREAITQGGDNALKKAMVRSPDDGLAPDGKMIRWLKIGFDRAELLNLLGKQEIEHAIEAQPLPVPQDENSGAANDGGATLMGHYSLRGLQKAAAHLEVTAKTISSYMNQGMPHLVNPGPDCKYRFNPNEIQDWHATKQQDKRKKLRQNLKR